MNKYNNIHTICRLGHNHPSKGEADKCRELHLLLLVPELKLKSIEYEKSYPLIVEGVKVCTHRPDFTLNYIDRVEIVEYKGYSTPEWKLKLKLFKAIYPTIKYNVAYQKVRRLSKNAAMKLIVKNFNKKK